MGVSNTYKLPDLEQRKATLAAYAGTKGAGNKIQLTAGPNKSLKKSVMQVFSHIPNPIASLAGRIVKAERRHAEKRAQSAVATAVSEMGRDKGNFLNGKTIRPAMDRLVQAAKVLSNFTKQPWENEAAQLFADYVRNSADPDEYFDRIDLTALADVADKKLDRNSAVIDQSGTATDRVTFVKTLQRNAVMTDGLDRSAQRRTTKIQEARRAWMSTQKVLWTERAGEHIASAARDASNDGKKAGSLLRDNASLWTAEEQAEEKPTFKVGTYFENAMTTAHQQRMEAAFDSLLDTCVPELAVKDVLLNLDVDGAQRLADALGALMTAYIGDPPGSVISDESRDGLKHVHSKVAEGWGQAASNEVSGNQTLQTLQRTAFLNCTLLRTWNPAAVEWTQGLGLNQSRVNIDRAQVMAKLTACMQTICNRASLSDINKPKAVGVNEEAKAILQKCEEDIRQRFDDFMAAVVQ